MAVRKSTGLRVWQEAHPVRLTIYKITKAFPPDERYDLVSHDALSCSSIGPGRFLGVSGQSGGFRLPVTGYRLLTGYRMSYR